MFLRPRHLARTLLAAIAALSILLYLSYQYQPDFLLSKTPGGDYTFVPSSYNWAAHKHKYPIDPSTYHKTPVNSSQKLPPVQHPWTEGQALVQARSQSHNLEAVLTAFKKTYGTYESLAFGHDEVAPITGASKDPFSGFGATLIDSLDVLWIMSLQPEWERAVQFVAKLNWDAPIGDTCNLFETGIRYLGGLLSAYDLSSEPVLLQKAVELADMMYAAWDNPQHLPRGKFTWAELKAGDVPPLGHQSISGIGSFAMEFTRLSILTGNDKYYDAIHRITLHFARVQNQTSLPGLWPVHFNAQDNFNMKAQNIYSYGASADSFYEYLIKMHALLGGQEPLYATLYNSSTAMAEKHLMYRPRIPGNENILAMGEVTVNKGEPRLKATMTHLTCFTGAMFLLGTQILSTPSLSTSLALSASCPVLSRLVQPSGILPEIAMLEACTDREDCVFDLENWKHRSQPAMPQGYINVQEGKYILRPEAIESVFYAWRVTGNQKWVKIAEEMWTALVRACEGKKAFASLKSVLGSKLERKDSMESFFLAETLKYFYLIFANPLMINLDEWVFNTEAHPFKRLLPKE